MANKKNDKGIAEEAGMATPATADVAVEAPQSQRDRYRSRVKEMSPELDMDNEDAYYEAANKRMDDYEALNKGVDNLRGVMDNNPYFAEMIAEAKKNKDFNPVLYMIENGSLDLEALQGDPEYSQKIADAQNTWLKKKADADESDRVLGENLRNEIAGCIEDGMAQGLTEEEALEQVGKTFEYLDKLDKGEIRELNAILLKGVNYDTAVEDAQRQGEATGRAAKVKDTLRNMPKQSVRSGGSQPQGAEPQPTSGESMFGL